MSTGFFPKREKLDITELWRGLITASHILHRHGVVDAFGHISVRNPDNHDTFYMPRNMAPALLSKAEDIVEYKIEDASSVEQNAPKGYIERFIHSELYKRFPTINSVIHCHAEDVLPYCISEVPLKATIHMAGFLGSDVPVWDISSTYSTFSSSDPQDLLVRNTSAGHSLAATFKPSTSAGFIYTQMKSALPNIGGKKPTDTAPVPDHPVVLMRGHGFTTCADGIEEAVYQAIYTTIAARAQTAALSVHSAHFGASLEGKVDTENGGKIKGAKVKGEGKIQALSAKEAGDAWAMNKQCWERPWALWCREVQISPLYVNECKGDE